MLARADRLRLGRDIDRVYKLGRYGGGEELSVKVLEQHSPQKRVVVIVGKKVSKKAVVRNHNRRRLTEIISGMWQQILPGCDIVVTVRSDTATFKPDELKQQMIKALERAGALKKDK